MDQESIVSSDERVSVSQAKHCKTEQDAAYATLREAGLVLTRT